MWWYVTVNSSCSECIDCFVEDHAREQQRKHESKIAKWKQDVEIARNRFEKEEREHVKKLKKEREESELRLRAEIEKQTLQNEQIRFFLIFRVDVWYVAELLRWGGGGWCVNIVGVLDVADVLIVCWCVNVADVLTSGVLMCWCADVLMCVNVSLTIVLMCWLLMTV
jgi:hypothetical protein